MARESWLSKVNNARGDKKMRDKIRMSKFGQRVFII